MGHIAKTDAELVEASRRGEREAFGQLVTRYQDVVCAVSFSSTGNWALSQDVAQDTFLTAWRQLGQLREIGRLRSWLCSIARNLARKARKRTDREAPVEESDDFVAMDANPFDRAAQAEVDRVVREALARIPDGYRETLVLYYCENRSIRDVAAVLGVSEDAAMQRLTRGRRYLASGVSDLVERSLRGARPRKGLAAAVVAALPLAHASPVDASPKPEGSTMFLKVGLAAAIFAAIGTTAIIVHDAPSSDAKPAAAAHDAPATPVIAAKPVPAPSAPSRARPPALAVPGAAAAAPIVDDDAPHVVDSGTIAKLALDRGPARGPANAPVTIIVFQDVLCTYCGTALATLDQLWDDYPGKLRIVVKQFPVHKEARLAAEAAFAADEQGKFWELHDVMIANQDDLSRDALVGYAQQAGLDAKKLAKALDDHRYAKALEKEMAAAEEVGIHATPSFLINGREVRGARPPEAFRAIIDEALAAATP
jgi:RNA polymerase sigma factor (sigma-70 family)